MAEEITTLDSTQVQQEPTQPTEIELRARDEGWVPQDEWQGDPDAWRPAKEFVDRGELFKKIDDQNRTIKEFKRALDDLKNHHSKVRDTEYKRALESLKAQKKAAFEEGDADRIISIEDEIDLVKQEQSKLKEDPITEADLVPVNPTFSNWVSRNKWYETNEPMRAFADALGRNLARGGMSPDKVLEQVEKDVRAEFPNRFKNPNKDKPGAVESSTNKGGRGTDSFSLSEEDRRVMQRFVRQGIMTEKEYIAELKRVNGV
jgi:hypothetical protein